MLEIFGFNRVGSNRLLGFLKIVTKPFGESRDRQD